MALSLGELVGYLRLDDSQIERVLGGLPQRFRRAGQRAGEGLDRELEQGAEDAADSAEAAAEQGGRRFAQSFITTGIGPIKARLGTMGKEALIAFGALAGAGGIGAILSSSMDISAGNDKLAAQLGLTERQSQKSGEVAGKLYGGAYGESMEEVNTAVGAVMSSIKGMRKASTEDLQAMTAKALDFATAFEVDVTRAAQVAGQMVSSGLAKDADQAFDLLVSASQKVPAAVREDVLDAIDEYGPMFDQLGYSGEEAMSLLVKGAEKGMYGIDKTGDALKEFTILAGTDLARTGPIFEQLGMDAEGMSGKILKGGPAAKKATDEIIRGILGIKDPVAQSQAALAMFGTPLEDLGTKDIPKFLEGLLSAEGGLGKVEGASERMGTTLNDNAKTNLESFRRQAQMAFVDILGGKALPFIEDAASVLATEFGPTLEKVQGFLADDIVPALQSTAEWMGENETTVLALAGVLGGLVAVTTLHSTVMRVQQAGGLMAVAKNLRVVQAVTKTYAAVQWVLNAALSANPLGLIVVAAAAVGLALYALWTKSETFRNIVKGALNAVGDAGTWLYNKALKPAFNSVIGVLVAAYTMFRTFKRVAGEAIDGAKNVVRMGLQKVVGFFLDLAEGILKGADMAFGWIPGIGGKLDGARKDFAKFKEQVNRELGGIQDRNINIDVELDNHALQLVRKGADPRLAAAIASGMQPSSVRQAVGGPAGLPTGRVRGPGTTTSDSIPALLSRDEHVWTAREVANAGGHQAVEAIRARFAYAKGGGVGVTVTPRMPNTGSLTTVARAINAETASMAAGLRATTKTLAAFYNKAAPAIMGGGPVNAGLAGALSWARSQTGKPYHWGGVGPGGYDCSGFMSAIVNVIKGRGPHSRLFATGSFNGRNSVAGMVPGRNSAFRIGSRLGNPGHMAGTLNGVNVESRGGEGVVVGPRARGANDKLFTMRYGLAGYAKGGRVGDAAYDYVDPRGKHFAPADLAWLANLANSSTFDSGGLAHGKGLMAKATIRPERTLDPRQTEAFEKWMSGDQHNGRVGTTLIYNAAHGRSAAEEDLMDAQERMRVLHGGW